MGHAIKYDDKIAIARLYRSIMEAESEAELDAIGSGLSALSCLIDARASLKHHEASRDSVRAALKKAVEAAAKSVDAVVKLT